MFRGGLHEGACYVSFSGGSLKDGSDIRLVQRGITYNSIRPAAACRIMSASSEVTQPFSSMSASGTYSPLTAIRSVIAASAEVKP